MSELSWASVNATHDARLLEASNQGVFLMADKRSTMSDVIRGKVSRLHMMGDESDVIRLPRGSEMMKADTPVRILEVSEEGKRAGGFEPWMGELVKLGAAVEVPKDLELPNHVLDLLCHADESILWEMVATAIAQLFEEPET
jgi:hypothetical protein